MFASGIECSFMEWCKCQYDRWIGMLDELTMWYFGLMNDLIRWLNEWYDMTDDMMRIAVMMKVNVMIKEWKAWFAKEWWIYVWMNDWWRREWWTTFLRFPSSIYWCLWYPNCLIIIWCVCEWRFAKGPECIVYYILWITDLAAVMQRCVCMFT